MQKWKGLVNRIHRPSDLKKFSKYEKSYENYFDFLQVEEINLKPSHDFKKKLTILSIYKKVYLLELVTLSKNPFLEHGISYSAITIVCFWNHTPRLITRYL